MSNKPIYHYVYRITNIVENKHYYGKRSCRIEPKLDLGKKYFSSSRDKVFKKDQKDNPQNYKYKVIRCFESSSEAIEFEIRLHEKFDVGVNESFYNRAKQTSSKFDTTGVKLSRCLKGHNGNNAIPIDVYDYFTGELIATNVIANVWCKENNNSSSSLINTLKSNTSKPHNSNSYSEKFNPCHAKGVYAVRHGDQPKNFSKEHIKATELGKAVPIDIYNYFTGQLIAENVSASTWCNGNGYGSSSSKLLATLNGDISKPNNSSNIHTYNPCHHRGIYAVLHGDEPKRYSKEHIENTKLGHSGCRSVLSIPIDVYDYNTRENIAENVIAKDWCRENGYCYTTMNSTLKSDLSKPHNSNRKSPNYNPHHTKGIYARVHNPE
jgi:hypothetical protein